MVSAGTALRPSRIRTEGWNAGGKLTTREVESLDLGKIMELNPYTLEPDRSRWLAGFTHALAAERPVAYLKVLQQ